MLPDISGLSSTELDALIDDAKFYLAIMQTEAANEVKDFAESLGFTIYDLFPDIPKQKKNRKAKLPALDPEFEAGLLAHLGKYL